MSPTWLRSLLTNKKNTSAAGERKRKARAFFKLGVEELERRDLPSATFSLDSSGNLYNTTNTPPQLIDTGVQSFAVANNQVIDLHLTTGLLQTMNSDGSGTVPVDTGVTSFKIDGAGDVIYLSLPAGSSTGGNLAMYIPTTGVHNDIIYQHATASYVIDSADGGSTVALDDQGNLYNFPGGPSTIYPLFETAGVTSFQIDGAGDVIYLSLPAGSSTGGNLAMYIPATGRHNDIIYQHATASYVIDSADGGSTVALDDQGNLYNFPGGPSTIYPLFETAGVTSFKIDGAGDVIYLSVPTGSSTGGTLAMYFPTTGVHNDLSGINGHATASYAIDGAGNTVALDDQGNLYDYVTGSIYPSLLDSGVISFVVDGAGSVVEFVQGSGLNRFTEGGDPSDPSQNGNMSYPDSTLHRFTNYALDGAGARSALDTLGNLWRYGPASKIATLLDSGINSFVVDGAGSVVEYGGGGLNRFTEGGDPSQNGNMSYPDSTFHTFTSYALDGAGALVALDTLGNLWRYGPASTIATLIDSGISSFVVDGAGSVVEYGGGGLNRFTEGGDPSQNGNMSYPDSTLHTFTSYALDGVGALVALDTLGNLWRYGPASKIATLLDSGISSFVVDGAGSVVEYGGGGLNRFTEGGDPSQNGNMSYPDGTFHHFTGYAIDGAGALVALDTLGELWRYGPASKIATLLGENVTSFAVDGSGAPYWLTTAASGGWLEMKIAGSGVPQVVATNVTSFVVDGSGSVVALEQGDTAGSVAGLQQGGHLVRFAPGGGAPLLISGWTSVTSYALDGAESVVALFEDGSLRRFAPGANGASNPINDSPVVSFVVDGSGSVVALEQGDTAGSVTDLQQGGHLVRFAPGGIAPLLISGWTSVTSYALDGSLSVVALFEDGSLRLFVPGANGASNPLNPTGVSFSQFVVDGDGSVVALQAGGGDLVRFTPGVPSQVIDETAQSVGVDGSGDVVEVEQNGLFLFSPGAISGRNIDPGVVSFGFRSDGLIYAWHADGDLTLDNTGGQQLVDFGVVQSFAVGGDGSGYFLQNGNLMRNTPAANYTISSVAMFGFRSDGLIYAWHSNGDLTLDSADGQQILDFGVVASFAMGSDGSGYFLENGYLARNTPAANFTIPSVQSFGFRSDGLIYAWHANGDLTLNNPTGLQLLDFGIVQSFAMGPDGSGYFLQSGYLTRNTPQQNISFGAAQAFGIRDDGLVYVLATNGDLSVYTPNDQPTYDGDVGVVQGFSMGADGTAYYLQNGNLIHNSATTNVTVATGVNSFVIGPNGMAIYLISNPQYSNLYQEGNSNAIEQIVSMFALDGRGGIYVLLQNQQVYDETTGGTRIHGVGTNVPNAFDTNVIQIASDGHGGLYELFTNNNPSGYNLFDVTYGFNPNLQDPGWVEATQTPLYGGVAQFYFNNAGHIVPVYSPGIGQIFADIGAVVAAAVITYFSAGALSEVGVGLAASVIGEGTVATIVGGAIGAAAASALVQEAEHIAFGTQFNWANVLQSGLTAGLGDVGGIQGVLDDVLGSTITAAANSIVQGGNFSWSGLASDALSALESDAFDGILDTTGLLDNTASFLSNISDAIANTPLVQDGVQVLSQVASGVLAGQSITTSFAQGMGSFLDQTLADNLVTLPFGAQIGSLLGDVVSGNVSASSLLQSALPMLDQTVAANLGGGAFGNQLGTLLNDVASGTPAGSFLQVAGSLLQDGIGANIGTTLLGGDLGTFLNGQASSILGDNTLANTVAGFLQGAATGNLSVSNVLQSALPTLEDTVNANLGGGGFGDQLDTLLQAAASGNLSGANFLQTAGSLLQDGTGSGLGNTQFGQDVGAFLNQEASGIFATSSVGAFLQEAANGNLSTSNLLGDIAGALNGTGLDLGQVASTIDGITGVNVNQIATALDSIAGTSVNQIAIALNGIAGTTVNQIATALDGIAGTSVNQIATALETVVQQNLSPGNPISVQVNSSNDAAEFLGAVDQLPSIYSTTPVTVTLNLAAGPSYGDINASPPAGVTLVINGLPGGTETIVGHSPALTVSSGTVVVTGVTLTTASDAPTILVTGGSLELRKDDIEESTGFTDPAISMTGGSVDLGTASDPGINILDVNGTGTWIANTTANPIVPVGDMFEINGVVQSATTAGVLQLSAASNTAAEGAGYVTYTANRIGTTAGPVSVQFSTANGTAVGGLDYTPATLQTVNFADGQASATFTVPINDENIVQANRTFSVTLENPTGNAVLGTQVSETTTITDPLLQVAGVDQTPSGVVVHFNRAFDPSTINLYNAVGSGLGAADMTLVGATTGVVSGSLVFSPTDPDSFTFIKTGAPLLPDTYTLTIRAGSDAFHGLDGRALDGDDDGNPGGNYVEAGIVVSAPLTPVVTAPDFAFGPGQAVSIPLTLSNFSETAASVTLDYLYDPSLLNITGVSAGTLTNTNLSAHVSDANLRFAGSVGDGVFAALSGTVADLSPAVLIGSKAVNNVTDVMVNGVAAGGDLSVQILANFGDVTDSRFKTAQDATLIAQTAVGLGGNGADTFAGFAAFKNADPTILADITGDGSVDAADASLSAQWSADVPGTGIPDPTGDPIALTAGADPRLYLPQISAAPGQTVTVALRLDAVESFNLTSADIAFLFNASVFQISNLRLSSSLEGFAVAPNIDNTNGTLKASIFTGTLGQDFVQGEDVPLLLFDVTVSKNAPAVATPLNLAQQVGGVQTELNGGTLTLNPGPTNGAYDGGVDGLLTVVRPSSSAAAKTNPLPKLTTKNSDNSTPAPTNTTAPSTTLATTVLDQYWTLEGQKHGGVGSKMIMATMDSADWDALASIFQSMKKSPW